MQNMQGKKLYRSRTNYMLFGVCGGLGDYFGIDPTLVRIAFVLATFLTAGTAALLYLVLFFIIPPEPTGMIPGGGQ